MVSNEGVDKMVRIGLRITINNWGGEKGGGGKMLIRLGNHSKAHNTNVAQTLQLEELIFRES